MTGSRERVLKAFAHETPDRTPLFEIFQPFHPIYWDLCGRNPGTDAVMYWDALCEGLTWQEWAELRAQALFQVNKFFQTDIVHSTQNPVHLRRPVKTGPKSWRVGATDFVYNEKTHLVIPLIPQADSLKIDEAQRRQEIESWEGPTETPPSGDSFTVIRRLRELATAEGLDWMYMAEVGAGTGVAFWPPFMLMWVVTDPDLVHRWLEMQKARIFPQTAALMDNGCELVALGGDVSCDKGPFISPRHYHEFILPVIQEHVGLVHQHGAKAIYTSDGNQWPIQEDFFFNSGIDGYKEVDKAAGMTWPRLIEAGIDRRVCIVGNLDARYTLCLGTPEEVKQEVREGLDYGQRSPGGHILHASHSVHEDVRVENYYAAVEAYREYFGLEPLPR